MITDINLRSFRDLLQWQEFPDEQIKILRKISDFDLKLKNYFLNDLSENINCNRLLCPACIAGRLV